MIEKYPNKSLFKAYKERFYDISSAILTVIFRPKYAVRASSVSHLHLPAFESAPKHSLVITSG